VTLKISCHVLAFTPYIALNARIVQPDLGAMPNLIFMLADRRQKWSCVRDCAALTLSMTIVMVYTPLSVYALSPIFGVECRE